MIKESEILEGLYQRESVLNKQLKATQDAIIGFGGSPKGISSETSIMFSEELETEIEPIKKEKELMYSKLDDLHYIFEGAISIEEFVNVCGRTILYNSEKTLGDYMRFIHQKYSKSPKLPLLKQSTIEDEATGIIFRVESIKTHIGSTENPDKFERLVRIKVSLPEEEIKRTRYNRSDVYGFMEEILKEVGLPMNTKLMQTKLEQLSIVYKVNVLAGYLSDMVKEGKALRVIRGEYAHIDYRHPEKLKKNVKTIIEVEDYIKLRGEVTRKDLIDHFVKGGRMNENRVGTRIEMLLKEGTIKRKERGVYKWTKKSV